MEPLWLAIALACGLGARSIGLPPLVGYLLAGFALHAIGVEGGEVIDGLADVGILLMLFSIGLKLQLRTLARPVIWVGTSIHMLVTVVALGGLVFAFAALGLPAFAGLDTTQSLLLAFALSFSSTVLAVKALEEKGEMGSQHGKTAIGVLIMQDVIAIVFLTVSKGELPSPWAIAVVAGLFAVRPLVSRMMSRSGHGELLILFGLVLALGTAGLFEAVGLKPDLGALVAGVLLAQHARAGELAKSLLDFKDLLLISFFLSVGLTGTPTMTNLGVAALLCIAVLLKSALFFWLFCRFRLRARNSFLASLSLTNYSEFGLIVAAVGLKQGWITAEWLIILAMAVSITFIVASPLNSAAHSLWARYGSRLKRFESEARLPEDEPFDVGEVEAVVIGMETMGERAYEVLREKLGDKVVGLDRDPQRVSAQRAAGRRVFLGDSTDPDLYERLSEIPIARRLLLLMFSNHQEKLTTVRLLREAGRTPFIATLAQHEDEVQELQEAGVQVAVDLAGEAGRGFARDVLQVIEDAPPTEQGAGE